MSNYTSENKPLLALLLKRSGILLFAWVMSLFFLYVVGSFQGFLEANIVFLYRAIGMFAPILGGLSLAGFLSNVFFALYFFNFRYLTGALIYLLSIIISILFIILSNGLFIIGLGVS